MTWKSDLRKNLWREQRGKCAICGTKMRHAPSDIDRDYDIDHIIPKSKGGTIALSNLQLAHKRCNRAKGSEMPGSGQGEVHQEAERQGSSRRAHGS